MSDLAPVTFSSEGQFTGSAYLTKCFIEMRSSINGLIEKDHKKSEKFNQRANTVTQ
jgi:hypothetical protein